jgi:hypothetical protein
MPAITRAPIRRTSPISQTYLACEHRGAVHADGDLTKPRTDPPERIPAVPRWRGYRSPRRRTLPHSSRRGPRPGRPCRRSAKLFANSLFRAVAGIRHRGAPELHTGRPVGSLWPIGRHPMPEHLGRIKRVTKHPGLQPNSIIGPSHIATRASAAISFLSNPGGVRTTDASSHPAETTNLRKLRCPVTRRGFDVVSGVRRKSLCFSASCREITHR